MILIHQNLTFPQYRLSQLQKKYSLAHKNYIYSCALGEEMTNSAIQRSNRKVSIFFNQEENILERT